MERRVTRSIFQKIRIEKLFHEYDFEIDLKQICTIIIGSNGIGKSTALKLIQNLLQGSFMIVPEYVFERIIVTDIYNQEYVLHYEDFIISKEEIIEKYEKLLWNSDIKDKAIEKELFIEMIDEYFTRGLYGLFLIELNEYGNDDNYYSDSINEIMNKFCNSDLVKQIKLLDEEETQTGKAFYSFKEAPILKSEFAKLLKMQFMSLTEKSIFYYDLVKKANIKSRESLLIYNYSETFTEQYRKWGNSIEYYEQSEYRYFYIKDNDFFQYKSDLENEEFKAAFDIDHHLPKRSNDPFSNYSFLKYGNTFRELADDLMKYFSHSVGKDNEIEINPVIKASFSELAEKINIYLKKYSLEYMDRLELAIINPDLRNKILDIHYLKRLLGEYNRQRLFIDEYYVQPLLAQYSPFSHNIRRIKKIVSREMEKEFISDEIMPEVILLQSYLELLEQVGELDEKYFLGNEKMNVFRFLIGKYIEDKTICITPKGLRVFKKSELDEKKSVSYKVKRNNGQEIDVNDELVFGNPKEEISIDALSSGETKIIGLLFTSIYVRDKILMMDEPELSISILWQEHLLKDLIDYGTFVNVIVATHSPYIARAEELSNYILYLP